MSQSFELLALQEIDSEAAALRAAIDSLEQRLAGNSQLDDARRELQYVDAELAKRRTRQRRVETEIDDINAKIGPEETRLYDGSITSPKELESLQKEITFLTGNRSQQEDRLLAVLSQIEELELRRRAANQKIGELEREWDTAQVTLRGELHELQQKLGAVQSRRDEQKGRATPRNVGLYEDLRPRKGGVAVSPIKAGACSSCRVSLPGAVRSQTLDKDSVVQCPNCERILTPG